MPTPTPATSGLLVDIAIWAHEMFLSFITAGFDVDQALYLTGELVVDFSRDDTP